MRHCRLLAATALAVTVLPVRMAAQEVGRSPLGVVEYWNDVYSAAYHQYQAKRGEFGIVDGRWDMLIEQFHQQHEQNPARADRLLGEIQQLSADRTRAQSAVHAARRQWEDAGDSLVEALDNYLEILNTTIRGTPLGDSTRESITQYRTWNNRLQEVEAEIAPSLSLTLEPMPEVVARDDDSAADLDSKARIVENRARRDSATIVVVEDKIASLRKRQDRDRSTADLRSRIERFSDMTVPVETTTEGVGVNVPDSTEVGLKQTPEQRIQALETFRDEISARVHQLLERAGELREEAARRRS